MLKIDHDSNIVALYLFGVLCEWRKVGLFISLSFVNNRVVNFGFNLPDGLVHWAFVLGWAGLLNYRFEMELGLFGWLSGLDRGHILFTFLIL